MGKASSKSSAVLSPNVISVPGPVKFFFVSYHISGGTIVFGTVFGPRPVRAAKNELLNRATITVVVSSVQPSGLASEPAIEGHLRQG